MTTERRESRAGEPEPSAESVRGILKGYELATEWAELQRVSELLVMHFGETTRSSVSEHLADVIARLTDARAATSAEPVAGRETEALVADLIVAVGSYERAFAKDEGFYRASNTTRSDAIAQARADMRAAREALLATVDSDAQRWRKLVAIVDAAPGGIVLWSMRANEHDAAEASIQALTTDNPTQTVWFSDGATLDEAIDAAAILKEASICSRCSEPRDGPGRAFGDGTICDERSHSRPVIQLHQAYDDAPDVCFKCGKRTPWGSMEPCPAAPAPQVAALREELAIREEQLWADRSARDEAQELARQRGLEVASLSAALETLKVEAGARYKHYEDAYQTLRFRLLERIKRLEEKSERASDYRAGYSTGYADAKAKTPMWDEEAAALFLGTCPLWDVSVSCIEPADGEPFTFDAEIHALDEATAIEHGEEKCRAEHPTVEIRPERSRALPSGDATR